MNLFDVLKYSGTNLDSVEELYKLPHDLFRAYRKAAYTHYGTEDHMDFLSPSDEIEGMAEDWCNEDCPNIKQIIFNKVLKDYNNEPV